MSSPRFSPPAGGSLRVRVPWSSVTSQPASGAGGRGARGPVHHVHHDAEARAPEGVQVDHAPALIEVRGREVGRLHEARGARLGYGHAAGIGEARDAGLDRSGHLGPGGPTGRARQLEPVVRGRVVAGRDRDPRRRMMVQHRVRHRRRRDRGHREATPDARLREGASGLGREVLGKEARVVADDGAVRRLPRLLQVVGDRARQTAHVREGVRVRDPRAPPGGSELDRIEPVHHPCPVRSIIGSRREPAGCRMAMRAAALPAARIGASGPSAATRDG
jgi:hypothetical protein